MFLKEEHLFPNVIEREEAFERLEMDSEKSEAGNAREFIMPNTDKQAVEIE